VTHALLPLLLLLGPSQGDLSGAVAALVAAPRTAETVSSELSLERKALRRAERDLLRAAHARTSAEGEGAPDLDGLRGHVAARRIRCAELRSELQRMREQDRRLEQAGLGGDRLREARERVASLRGEIEARRLEVVEGRLLLTRAVTEEERGGAEARLTRAEERLAAASGALERALRESLGGP
jgi:hypothetical protein